MGRRECQLGETDCGYLNELDFASAARAKAGIKTGEWALNVLYGDSDKGYLQNMPSVSGVLPGGGHY